MSPSGNLDWVWYGAGAVLALLGLALAYWSLLHDRARGRRRCPKCWYDMSSPGPDPLTCPECGRIAKSEKKLFKTQRRWGWAIVALFFFIGAISLSLTPQVKREGWLSIVPRRGLILSLFFTDDYNVTVWTYINSQRRSDQKLWDMVLGRCIRGDRNARPVSEAWKRKYGTLINLFKSSRTKQFDPDLEAEWLTLPPQVHFEVRSPWPADVPVAIEPQIGEWWQHDPSVTLIVKPRWPEVGELEITETEDLLFLPSFALGEHQLTFDIQRKRIRTLFLSATSSPPFYRWEVDDLGLETLTRTIKIDGTIDDYLTANEQSELTASIRNSFQGVIKYTNPSIVVGGEYFPDKVFYRLKFDATPTFNPAYAGIAIGLRVELLLNDKLISTSYLGWPGGPMGKSTAYHARHLKLYGIPVVQEPGNLNGHDISQGVWKLRVTGDPMMALTIPGVTSYWSGSFETPAHFEQMK
ncbi:MAG: hypothetical protein IID30_05725 [Planctomycetes bacterium]|nr:hypothetical protein [Planctomycetota bacterium]